MAFEHCPPKSKRGGLFATTVALVIASGAPAHAQNLMLQSQSHPMIAAGGAAILGMRISFGGELRLRRSARFGLTFGSYWRDVPGSQLAAYRFLPTAEAGLTLSGEAVLKFGPIQIRRSVNGLGVDEPQREEGFCARNVKLCVGGVFLGAALIFLLADEKGYKEPCIDGNGCPT